MPAIQKQRHQAIPKFYHALLQTTFCGVDHSISTPDTPIHQYLGIKYASVPARFRQSRLCKSYPPIVNASHHGPVCPQPGTSQTIEEALVGIAAGGADAPQPQTLKVDEFECLNLNITCPAGLTPQSRVPVMLWVHGGGDRGSGSSWVYDGGPLVRKSLLMGKPVVLVTFNFRIGLFGFAASPMIREDNKAAGEDGVGNYGLRDQRKAMEWLHHYIADFGGDPGNITVFGLSSGGADILCHLLSTDNQTRPVFQRAIVQSALLEHNLPDVSSSGWQLSRVLSKLHVSTMEQFRSIDAEKIAALGFSARAVDDGVFFRTGWKEYFVKDDAHSRHHHQLKDHIAHAHTRARSRSSLRSPSIRSPSRTPAFAFPANLQPLIIGDCSADSTLWAQSVSLWTPSAAVRRIKAVCQSLSMASNIMRAYDISPYTPDDEIADHILELVDDARVAWPTECVSQSAKRERGGRGVWRYIFDQEGPTKGIQHHAADLIYLFDTVPLPATTQSSAVPSPEMFCESYGDSDDEEDFTYGPVIHENDDGEWATCIVDEWSYRRVRDAMQERWISFAHGEAPWREDKVFVFGPEGETGERSNFIFEGRRRKEVWKEALEPLGMQLVQKVGVELSRGPSYTF